MNEIVTYESTEQSTTLDKVLAVINSGNVSAEAIETLVKLHNQQEDRAAERMFIEQMNAVQSKLKPVHKRGKNKHTRSDYALMEDVDKMVTPIYTAHGFILSFGTEETNLQDTVIVTCDVSHISGHTRTYKVSMPFDDIGVKGERSKTRTHGVSSAITYGERYLKSMIFNVPITGNDDDGNGASIAYVSPDQAGEIRRLAGEVNADIGKFLQWMRCDSIETIPAAKFKKAIHDLERKRNAQHNTQRNQEE